MAKVFRISVLLVVLLSGCEWLNPDSTNSYLLDLTITGVDISPEFSPYVTAYTAAVSAQTSQTTVVASPAHLKATITVNGTRVSTEDASMIVPLSPGSNSITVQVTAENGSNVQHYIIAVTRDTTTYSVGGSVVGLSGTVTLQNNGVDDLVITADGPFAFATSLDTGADYDVTVSSQPQGQTCSVSNGSGKIVDADISSISVNCIASSFTVGGTVSGLAGDLTLQNNGADDLLVTANGSFIFTTAIVGGAGYDVTVSTQPAGQTCSVSNGSGTVTTANITDVSVTCATPVFTVGGTVGGLTGALILQNNGADDLSLTSDGSFAFSAAMANSSAYNVTVSTQPTGQTCSVSDGSGTIAGANITNISVSCTGNTAGSIFDWTWANPLPQGNSIMDVAWNGSQLVIVGTFGTVRTSPDGLAWTTRDPGTARHLFGVTWDGGKFVAVGEGGTIASSPDGVAWTVQSVGDVYTLHSIVWSGTQFVAVGQEEANAFGGAIATSPDGVVWSVQNFDLSGAHAWNDVAWNGTQFAAVQYPGYVHTSPDGVTWTTTDLRVANTDIRSIASDGGQFVATGFGVVYTSPDGATWTLQGGSSNMRGDYVTWDGSEFLAVGFDRVFRSVDGSNWSQQFISAPRNVLTSIINNGSRYILTGTNGLVFNSPDTMTWTSQSTGEFFGLTDVGWNGSLFVAVGHDQTIRTSPDGVNWTTQNNGSSLEALTGIAWNSNLFVAVGNGSSGQIVTSPDGLNWTSHSPSAAFLQLTSVVWGGNQFVAVGADGIIMTSTDGATWTAQTNGVSPTDNFIDVSWNGNLFVVTGSQGAAPFESSITTSPDGVNWTSQVLPWWAYLEDAVWNGSLFVAVGNEVIATSTDGLTWTTLQTSYPFLKSIAWTGSQFVAVGESSSVLISPDGIVWSATRSISGFYSAVASDGIKVVVVDQTGHIITNDAL